MQNLFTYGDYNPGPTGRHRPGATPCGLFQTRDGWIVFTVLNHQWERFAKEMNRDDLSNWIGNNSSVRIFITPIPVTNSNTAATSFSKAVANSMQCIRDSLIARGGFWMCRGSKPASVANIVPIKPGVGVGDWRRSLSPRCMT